MVQRGRAVSRGRGPIFFAITYYVSMYNRSTAIDHTVYRRYAQFVVSTTCYHILPYVAMATHLSFFDIFTVLYILYRAVIISRAKGRCTFCAFVYNISDRSHTIARCTVLFAYCALFMHFLSIFLQLLDMYRVIPLWYNLATIKRGEQRTHSPRLIIHHHHHTQHT